MGLSSVGVISIWGDAPDEGKKQLIFMFVGLGCLIAFQAVNYLHIGRFAWGFYVISILMIAYTLLPFIQAGPGDSRLFRVPLTGGAYNWINFGPIKVQPAELMKIAFCMVMARYLRFRSNYRTLIG